jgi:hypothetical protein
MTEAADLINPCVRCQYDLRGIADDQPCPECGLLAERSRRPSDRLRDSRPAYLRKLSLGLAMIVLAVPTPLVVSVALALLIAARLLTPTMDTSHLFLGAWDLGAVLFLIGVSLLTAQEAGSAPTRQRRILLALAAIPLVCCILLHLELKMYALGLSSCLARPTSGAM